MLCKISRGSAMNAYPSQWIEFVDLLVRPTRSRRRTIIAYHLSLSYDFEKCHHNQKGALVEIY